MNLGWRWGTAEREGCSGSAGRLLGAEGGQAMPMTGLRLSHCWWLQGWWLSKQKDTGHHIDRLLGANGIVPLVGQKVFCAGEPSDVPYF